LLIYDENVVHPLVICNQLYTFADGDDIIDTVAGTVRVSVNSKVYHTTLCRRRRA